MIRVAVTGAKGRMGSTVVAAVTGAPDMEVVAQLDAGDPITKKTVNGAQVAVDFSVPGVTEANVHALLDAGVDVVVGTTGWTEESYARVRTHAQEAGPPRAASLAHAPRLAWATCPTPPRWTNWAAEAAASTASRCTPCACAA